MHVCVCVYIPYYAISNLQRRQRVHSQKFTPKPSSDKKMSYLETPQKGAFTDLALDIRFESLPTLNRPSCRPKSRLSL